MPTSLPFPALESASLPAKNDPVTPDVKALLGKPKSHQEFSSAFNKAAVKSDVARKPDAPASRETSKTASDAGSSDDEVPEASEEKSSKKEAPLEASLLQTMVGVALPVAVATQEPVVSSDEGIATEGDVAGTEATTAAGEGTNSTQASPLGARFSTSLGSTWMRLKQKEGLVTTATDGEGATETTGSAKAAKDDEASGKNSSGTAIDGAAAANAQSILSGVALTQGTLPVASSAVEASKESENSALLATMGKRRGDPANFRGEKSVGDEAGDASTSEAGSETTSTTTTLASLLPDPSGGAAKVAKELVSPTGKDGVSSQIQDTQASKTQAPGLEEKFAALREKGVEVEVSGVNSSNGVQKKNLLNVDNKQVKTSAQKIGTDTANQGETTMFNLRQPAEFLARSIAPVIGAHLSSDARVETASSQVQQSNAAKATQVVNDIHELALSLPTESRKSVELRFDFGHQERLSVKVEMRDGTVHTTFNASSRELTETVNTAWNNQPIAADSSVKLADPVFATAPVENKGFSLDSGNGKGQQERQQAAQDDGSGSRALPSFFRSGSSTTSVKSSTPVVASDRHLQAFA